MRRLWLTEDTSMNIKKYKKYWIEFLGTHDGKGNSEAIVYDEPIDDTELFVEGFAIDDMYIENKEFIINLRHEYENKYQQLLKEAKLLRSTMQGFSGRDGYENVNEATERFDRFLLLNLKLKGGK